jgi:hypothetical protein
MDVDDPKNPLKNAQEIGKVECTLGKLIGSPKGKFESPLIGKGGKEGKGHPCARCVSRQPAICALWMPAVATQCSSKRVGPTTLRLWQAHRDFGGAQGPQ